VKRLILMLGILLAAAGTLSACGKKGPPEPPGHNEYPRQYPAQT
jgi:predicted small lipoprotein YifL